MRIFAALLTISSLAAQPGQHQSTTQWTPDLAIQVQRPANVTPSPDGKLAVWTQQRAVIETEKSEYLSQVFLWRGKGSPVQLTRGEKSSTNPAFSPDSRFVFFTSERSGKNNIYRIAIDGGEAEMLTDWKGALSRYEISPDGKWIAFAGGEPDADEEKAKKEKRDLKVVDDNPRNHSLWLIPIEADASGKRTPKRLVKESYHVGQFEWSPDSRRIAYEHRPRPEADYGRVADIAEVEVENGTVRELIRTGSTESQPHYSPDGRFIAFVVSADPPSSLQGSRIALFDRTANNIRALPASPNETPSIARWTPDSKRILFTEAKRTRSALYAIPLDGPASVLLEPSQGIAQYSGMSRDTNMIGATIESASEAPEAFLLNNGQRTQISQANTALAKPPLGETKVIRWKAKDGVETEGLLTFPIGFQQGTRYPMVLLIHGGPSGVYNEAFIGSPGVQSVASFASKGYAVLRGNIRGSTAYGRKFQSSNFKDWGGGDYNDLLAGVDHVVAMGVADPDKLAVMGWSYGGYMTSWVISQTTRFKAAIVGAGITNLWSMWGTNDIPSVLDDYFGGSPWDQAELYRQRSGLFFAKNVKTPTLFLHGEQDFRVPIGQAYEYYHALKALGVATKMVAYPRMPHGPNEPKFAVDIMQRHIDWVDKYAR